MNLRSGLSTVSPISVRKLMTWAMKGEADRKSPSLYINHLFALFPAPPYIPLPKHLFHATKDFFLRYPARPPWNSFPFQPCAKKRKFHCPISCDTWSNHKASSHGQSVVLQPTIYEEKNRYTHNEIEQILRRWFLLVVHKKIGDCSIFLQSPIIFFNMKYILTDF